MGAQGMNQEELMEYAAEKKTDDQTRCQSEYLVEALLTMPVGSSRNPVSNRSEYHE